MSHSWLLSFLLMISPINDDSIFTIKKEDKVITQIQREDFAIPQSNLPFIEMKKFETFMEDLDKKTFIAPKDAYIKGNMIISEIEGKRLYRKEFKNQFFRYYFSKGVSTIQLPLISVPARVDKDLISQINVKTIGQYVTYFNSNNQNRSHNISLATEAINNYVIFPEETFSFNEVVGRRTKDKGYLRAPVIVRGELSEDIGGGICQVSSTLFNAVDRAGVEIGERFSHSKRVPYVPKGRDATVSWYGPDFTFTNPYEFPLLISAHVYGGQMIVVIKSSDEIETSPRHVPNASKILPKEIRANGDT
ncbi:VanW family protein [Cytobacillus sp. FSL W7-1323]|nr:MULTISPECIES: VanW family protein [Cytobacillus]MEA1854325.1 VanW family protein [Cytobacillus sp. OWB-43]MED1607054.1 VanW family protein [Cytobacillus kochii]